MSHGGRPPVVLVTGAGSGIGRAISLAFGREDAVVIVLDRDLDSAHAVAGEIQGRGGVAQALQCDVAEPDEVDHAMDRILGTHGHLDVLCNVAGVTDSLLAAADVSPAGWDRVISVNLTGPYLFARRAIPIMIDNGTGNIINLASIAGIAGGKAGAAYTASKHGLVGLTKNIAHTYRDAGIRCNAICPGVIKTELGKTSARAGAPRGDRNPRYEVDMADRPRPGIPDDVAGVATFLASKPGSYINGQTIVVDGGWLAG